MSGEAAPSTLPELPLKPETREAGGRLLYEEWQKALVGVHQPGPSWDELQEDAREAVRVAFSAVFRKGLTLALAGLYTARQLTQRATAPKTVLVGQRLVRVSPGEEVTQAFMVLDQCLRAIGVELPAEGTEAAGRGQA